MMPTPRPMFQSRTPKTSAPGARNETRQSRAISQTATPMPASEHQPYWKALL